MVDIEDKKTFQLEQDEWIFIGQKNIKYYITKFYKILFGEPAHNYFSLIETKSVDIPKISQEKNNIITTDFVEKEVYMKL
jgi:hypothetical protein